MPVQNHPRPGLSVGSFSQTQPVFCDFWPNLTQLDPTWASFLQILTQPDPTWVILPKIWMQGFILSVLFSQSLTVKQMHLQMGILKMKCDFFGWKITIFLQKKAILRQKAASKKQKFRLGQKLRPNPTQLMGWVTLTQPNWQPWYMGVIFYKKRHFFSEKVP